MKFGHAFIGALAIAILPVSQARSNVGPPIQRWQPAPQGAYSRLDVTIDPTAEVSILSFSQVDLRKAGYELRKIEPPKTGDWSPSKQRSIVAALAMSLGLAGVFLTRKRRAAAITTGVVAATIVVGAMSLQAWANVSAPLRPLPADQPPVFEGPPFKAGEFNAQSYLKTTIRVGRPQADNQLYDFVYERMNYGLNPGLFYRLGVTPDGHGIDSLPPIPFAPSPKVTTSYPFNPVPTSIHYGVEGLTPDFASMLQLKPAAGLVRVDSNSKLQRHFDSRDYYHGDVVIQFIDGEQGVKLKLGTKHVATVPATVVAPSDAEKPRN